MLLIVAMSHLLAKESWSVITIIQLQEESVLIHGSGQIAFKSSLQFHIKMLKRVSGLASGVLFNLRRTGLDRIAFTRYYDPDTLFGDPR